MKRGVQNILCIRLRRIWRYLLASALLAIILIAVDLSINAVRFANTRRHLESNGWEVHGFTEIPAGSFAPVKYSLPLSYSTGFGLFGATEATFHHFIQDNKAVAFDEEDAIMACTLPGLKMLRITCQGRHLPAVLCERIGNAPHLRFLQLDNFRFQSASLSKILGNMSLEVLSLSNYALTAFELITLSESSTLREIRLLRCGLSRDEITQLQERMPQCTITFMGN